MLQQQPGEEPSFNHEAPETQYKAETQYNDTSAAQGQEHNNELQHDTQRRSQQIKMKALFAAAHTASSQQTSSTPSNLPPPDRPMFYDLLHRKREIMPS